MLGGGLLWLELWSNLQPKKLLKKVKALSALAANTSIDSGQLIKTGIILKPLLSALIKSSRISLKISLISIFNTKSPKINKIRIRIKILKHCRNVDVLNLILFSKERYALTIKNFECKSSFSTYHQEKSLKQSSSSLKGILKMEVSLDQVMISQ